MGNLYRIPVNWKLSLATLSRLKVPRARFGLVQNIANNVNTYGWTSKCLLKTVQKCLMRCQCVQIWCGTVSILSTKPKKATACKDEQTKSFIRCRVPANNSKKFNMFDFSAKIRYHTKCAICLLDSKCSFPLPLPMPLIQFAIDRKVNAFR